MSASAPALKRNTDFWQKPSARDTALTLMCFTMPKAEAETLRDEIKTEMLNRNTEEMEAGQYIVRWTSVLSQRFDSTAFKKVMPDVYKSFIKQTASRRFSIN